MSLFEEAFCYRIYLMSAGLEELSWFEPEETETSKFKYIRLDNNSHVSDIWQIVGTRVTVRLSTTNS